MSLCDVHAPNTTLRLAPVLCSSSGSALSADSKEAQQPFATRLLSHVRAGYGDQFAQVALARAVMQMKPERQGSGRRVSTVMPAETRSARRILITIKVDVVDAHFAGLDTIHYLLKVLVFDLQSIANQ